MPDEREECMVHVPSCVRVNGEWVRRSFITDRDPGDETRTVYYTATWKTLTSVVTSDDVKAFDIDRAYREKRAQSDEAFEKFRQDFMK